MKVFYPAFGITALILAATFYWQGPEILWIVIILAILELSLSFDNAVVNATVLKRMTPFWQQMFLTVGILIAVFGMRLLFPILIVSLTAGLSMSEVVRMALDTPEKYEEALTAAHPSIAAFGGIFLLMIALDFFFESRDIRWIAPLEKMLSKIGGVDALSSTVALIIIAVSANALEGEEAHTVLVSGIWGLVTYLAVNGLAGFFEVEADEDDEETAGISGPASRAGGAVATTAKASFFLFLYLEVLDASFSFDGAISAFAISNQIFVIATGLGIGALYIRSMTVYLVRQGTLDEYRYLEHGAHYAIAVLGILLFGSLFWEIPEVVTGLTGVAFIGASFLSSIQMNKKEKVTA
jgi:uncharacterized protein